MKPGNVFLVAILVGALAAAMGVRYVHNLQQQIAEIRNSGNRPTVDVVVANDQIPIGSRIEANQVKLVAWPIEAQPEGTARATKDVLGSIARATIERNQPILHQDLVAQGAGLLPVMIPEGMRGMSVRVDPVTGVRGLISSDSPGERANGRQAQGDRDQRSRVVLQ